MRQDIINYLSAQNLGTYRVSTELPFDDNGTPLYLKNVKRIYVDSDDTSQDAIIATLDGVNIERETTTIRVYFASDAKNLPSNYDTVVNAVKLSRDVTTISGVSSRTSSVTKTYEQDLLVSEFEIQFTKLT